MTHFEKKLCEIKPEAWTLTPRILVRIQVPQPKLSCWDYSEITKIRAEQNGDIGLPAVANPYQAFSMSYERARIFRGT
jgi:hypothetical protein